MAQNQTPFNQGKLITSGAFIFFAIVALIVLATSSFKTIDPGQRGVVFRPFTSGLDKTNIKDPGFTVIAPWNDLLIYEVREQQIEEAMEVMSKNGLSIKVDVTVRFNPMYDKIGDLHEKFGRDYKLTLVRPETRSAVRKIIGRFEGEELYSTKRDEVQALIEEDLEKTLKENFIELRKALIRDIELPAKVKNAIEVKLEEEQKSLQYQYKLDRERQEAERIIIAAEAKAKANDILSSSLTANILQEKGIEATLELAQSQNTKVIVVGGGGEGLPLILGGQ